MTLVSSLLPLRGFENLVTDFQICRIKQIFHKVLAAFMDFLLDLKWMKYEQWTSDLHLVKGEYQKTSKKYYMAIWAIIF